MGPVLLVAGPVREQESTHTHSSAGHENEPEAKLELQQVNQGQLHEIGHGKGEVQEPVDLGGIPHSKNLDSNDWEYA